MYNEIYGLCKIRNNGGALSNGLTNYPPRFQFIIDLLESNGFKYEIIKFKNERFPLTFFYNIYIKGSGDKMAIAHHDVYNFRADNANDNSASIINCLVLKKMNPNLNIAIIDGEEPPCMGIGSKKLADDINDDYFGSIQYVLNLELTGIGGESFFVGKMGSKLEKIIVDMFDPFVTDVPFNDSYILLENGIDSAVVTTLPIINGKEDYSVMYQIHTMRDSVESISVDDMQLFVENVASKLLK